MERKKHKDSNRFKFIPFSERISQINIDVFHRVPHQNEEIDNDEANETFLNQSVQKWTVLNLTKEWGEFRKLVCHGGIRQLAQLLNRKDSIAQLFIDHIPLQTEHSLQPVLECLVAFVKDLRREFYPYYGDILKNLINLLKSHNPAVIEIAFASLAYIFKYLCRDLVKDLDKVLIDLAPLLNDNLPYYIQDFAAQSFSFVARRLKDPDKFLKLVLQTVQAHPQLTAGCGKLVFETIYGIKGQPHSTCSETLSAIFKGFFNQSLPAKLLYKLSTFIVIAYVNRIKPDHSTFFQVFMISMKDINVHENPKSLKCLLKLHLLALNFQQGVHLKEPEIFVNFLSDVMNVNETRLLTSEVCAKLLTLRNIRLSQDTASKFILKMLQQQKDVIIYFIEQITDYYNFEGMILPFFLNLALTDNNELDESILILLSKIIIQKTTPHFKLYPFEFKEKIIPEKMLHFIEQSENFEIISSYVIILPHIRNLDPKLIYQKFVMLAEKIINQPDSLFLLTLIFENLCHLNLKIELNFEFVNFQRKPSLMMYKALNYYLCIYKHNIDNKYAENAFVDSVDHLKSPYHKTRSTILELLQNLTMNYNKEINAVLNICLEVETVPLTITDYRQAVKSLIQLNNATLGLPDQLAVIPLRYLLGILFCNFKLLWDPVCEAITSYANTMAINSFWPHFYSQLQVNSDVVDRQLISEENLPKFQSEFLLDKARDWICPNERVDFYNYKYLLWKTAGNFPQVCEAKNRDVVPLILDFIQSNFMKRSTEHTFSCTIKNEDKTNINDSDINLVSAAVSTKIVGEQLRLISQFRDLRQIYRESDLRTTLFDLLLHRNVDIQLSALKCLLAYRWPYLTPYKEHLINLVDEQKFKDELVYFKVDKDEGVLKDVHRNDVMPIVLRILYSKMLSKVTSAERGNKRLALSLRRSLVLRFLAGCHSSEMEFFLKMSFRLLNLNIDPITTMESVDLDQTVHPKKLKHITNLADVVLDHFGGLLSLDLQKYMLQIILTIAAIVCGALLKRDQVHKGFIATLKDLRSECFDCLIKYFTKFQQFVWSEKDVDAIFKILVWPAVDRLAVESLHNPTPLLKLFECWSNYPRYFQLLCRYVNIDKKNETPLFYLMQLLLEKHCKPNVIGIINCILERLLTLKVDDEIEMEVDEISLLNFENIRPVDENALQRFSLKEELNYGTKILVPHIAAILDHLKRQLQNNERKGLTKTEAVILSRITELATSPEHADALIGLLLKVLSGKPINDDEILLNTLQTVTNLFRLLTQPKNYIRPFAELFGIIEPVNGRRLLLSCLYEISEKFEDLHSVAEIVSNLNAFDRRWVDQCDFNKRLDAFKSIRQAVAVGETTFNSGIFIMHTCFFFMKHEKDLSLRDSTDQCLQDLIPALLKSVIDNQSQREYISEVLLKTTRHGIASSDERLKCSSIDLLGHLSREVPECHFILNDLSFFANKQDTEVDFFENIHHLQIYRRVRALHRLCSISKTLTRALNTRTLTQFVLPLVTQFLCNEKFSGKNSLIDAAIECVGVVARFLPWHQYQALLRYYLLKLRTQIEFQKQCIRIISTILDNFMFNLSKSKGDIDNDVQENVTINGNDDDNMDNMENEGDEILNDLMEHEKEEGTCNTDEGLNMEIEDNTPVYEKLKVLSFKAAARVERAISSSLLDQLYKIIGERSTIEDTHKVNKNKLRPDRDEEDILRIPIAITLVKLLQKLPTNMLDTQLPGIFMRLCTFLKSRLESVRRVTKETLQEIMRILGPGRLSGLYREMTSLLTKGFQVHVLVFTMHAVLQSVQHELVPGQVDDLLPTIMQVCSKDLFGSSSEEKEIAGVRVKHMEVRANKSFNFLHLVAQFITERCLTDLIFPIKEALLTTHSHKMMTKCRECLRQIVLGLALNKFVKVEHLFQFIYGAISETIPQLLPSVPPPAPKTNPREKQDCFLLEPEPKSRTGTLSNPVKTSNNSGHILIEFGFHLLMLLLKKEKLKDVDPKPFLNPLVPILSKALESQHVKVITLAVQCLARLFKYDLPSLHDHINSITTILFNILHKFAAAGMSKGDNFELVMASFKAVSIIVRDVDYHILNATQLKTLLLYAEQDMHDSTRQALAFNLLKAVLNRKLRVHELHGVMLKVAELSVTSQLDHVRIQGRQTILQYMMDYPLGKKLERLIGFYLSQLNYSEDFGRLSALEMIFSFVNSFPEDTLKTNSGMFLITLGARLINDDNVKCKKIVHTIIKSMILKLDDKTKDDLFEILIVWFNNKKIEYKQLSAQVCGVFVTVEKSKFTKRLPLLLSILKEELYGNNRPGAFVRTVTDDDAKKNDHKMFQIMQLLLKICEHCPEFLTEPDYLSDLKNFTDISQNLLCHSHEWVRLAGSQFLGLVFTSIKPISIAKCLNKEDKLPFWDSGDLPRHIKSLILDHCAQLTPGANLHPEFLYQITKNLVYFAKILKDVEDFKVNGNHHEDEGENSEEFKLSLLWLVKRMRRIVNLEVVQTPGTHILRTAVFQWIAAVVVSLSKQELEKVLYHLIAPLVREEEVQGSTTDSPLLQLTRDIVKTIKKRVGIDVYAQQAVKIQGKLLKKRAERKTKKAQEFVVDPVRANKRKIERQLKKKEVKRRKIEKLSGKKSKRRLKTDK